MNSKLFHRLQLCLFCRELLTCPNDLNLEYTSRTKLSSMQKNHLFFEIFYYFFVNFLIIAGAAELGHRITSSSSLSLSIICGTNRTKGNRKKKSSLALWPCRRPLDTAKVAPWLEAARKLPHQGRPPRSSLSHPHSHTPSPSLFCLPGGTLVPAWSESRALLRPPRRIESTSETASPSSSIPMSRMCFDVVSIASSLTPAVAI